MWDGFGVFEAVFGQDDGGEEAFAAGVRREGDGGGEASGRGVGGATAEGYPLAGKRSVAPAERDGRGVEGDVVQERGVEPEAVAGGWPITIQCFILAFYYGKDFRQKVWWIAAITVITVIAVSGFAYADGIYGWTNLNWTWYDRAYLLGFLLALPLLYLYNGDKGRQVFGRYFFYAFYPLHLLLLTLICGVMAGKIPNYDRYLYSHIVALGMIVVMLVRVLMVRPSRSQNAVTLFLVLEAVYTLGFVMEIYASTPQGYTMACAVQYFGELLMLIAVLLFTSESCKVDLPIFVYMFHLIAAFACVYWILTFPETGFFYQSIGVKYEGGHAVGVFNHGVGYYCSVGYILIVAIEIVGMAIHTARKGSLLEKNASDHGCVSVCVGALRCDTYGFYARIRDPDLGHLSCRGIAV